MTHSKKIHILGICGTFMGSLAQLAKALGHRVTGSDAGVYPPMSDQLLQAGIELSEGFAPETIPTDTELVIIGNALSRGNPAVEYVLERNIPYISGPQWLGQEVLQNKWVLAVAGTHGKTTTASMLAWILEYAEMKPGFLIGGVPENFGVSARLGDSAFFVIEADEYDTAFFDKRSKFVHYRPRTAILNNLEFDHADIFPDLAAIERQFHHLIRTIPASGCVLYPAHQPALERVLAQGLWSEKQTLGSISDAVRSDWQWRALDESLSHFEITNPQGVKVKVHWPLSGVHNIENGLAAIAAAQHVGVEPALAAQALNEFISVKRRMEWIGSVDNVHIYDDFAHHPTAIETTLSGARAKFVVAEQSAQRILAVLEPRSNTMKLGIHKAQLADSVQAADVSFWFQPENMPWSVAEVAAGCAHPSASFTDQTQMIDAIVQQARAGDCIVVMSNGSFAGMARKLLQALQKKSEIQS